MNNEHFFHIAKQAAVNCIERHDYMPLDMSDEWTPHQWVVAAISAVATGETQRLQAAINRLKGLNHNQILAESAARHLINSGAKNYTGEVFTITLDDGAEAFEVVVTTQRVGAKSPHELHLEVVKECATLQTKLADRDALLLWALYHHQGGKSEVGQPIRRLLGIGQHERLTDEQIARATRVGGNS